MTYQGLGSYSREKADKFAQAPGESDESHRRRVQFWRGSEELADESPEWEAHRLRVDQAPTGTGLFGQASPQERQQALGRHADSSGRELERNGHLLGQFGIARVYAADIRGEGEREPTVSPLMAHLRGAATTEQWS